MAPIFVGSNNEDSRIRSNRIGFAASTADPGSLVTGDAYYNSTDNQLKIYDGSALSPVSGGGGTVELTASGSLSNGQTVIIKSDGTATGITTTGQSASMGSLVVVGTYGSSDWASTFDSGKNKVLLVYRTTSQQGAVRYATVSGTTVTLGTPRVFTTDSGAGNVYQFSAAFNPTDGYYIVVYKDDDDSNKGKLVLGTWTDSGNDETFTYSPVTFQTGGSPGVGDMAVVYDSNADKVAIIYSYSDQFGSGSAGVSKFRVGTINESSITLGSAGTFDSNYFNYPVAAFDSVNNKVVVAYRKGGSSPYSGEVKVGEISGSGSSATMSFGSAVSFSSVNTQDVGLAFDPNEGKFLIAYRDDSTAIGVAKIGVVSGNSMTIGAGTTFGVADTYDLTPVYDSNAKKFVINYKISDGNEKWYYRVANVDGTTITLEDRVEVFDNIQSETTSVFDPSSNTVVSAGEIGGASGDDSVRAYKIEYLNTTLTSENFIGFSDAAYTNGQTAKIQIVSSVDDAQTGLTTGSQLYVQKDGSLGTTADTPSVFAGTALSGTEISIKN